MAETRGVPVQRDDDYLRSLLDGMEADPDWRHDGLSMVMNGMPDQDKRDHHLMLLIDGGLVAPIGPQGHYVRVTMAGHDFLAHTRQPAVWNAVKAMSARLGGAGVGIMAQIAEAMIVQKARDLGMPI